MKTWLLLLLLLPISAHAWELIDPARRQAGIVGITTITDVLSVVSAPNGADRLPNPNLNPGHWIAFADDIGAGCRLITNALPDNPDPIQAAGYTYKGRYAFLEQFRGVPAVLLPTALFAHAHNVQVRVKLVIEDSACRVIWLQTCANPANCAP